MPSVILTTTKPCEAHRYHRPVPTYSEWHHVIPRAWQAFWQPPGTPRAVVIDPPRFGDESGVRTGREVLTEPIFDPRTVALCRTGHGNVHFWLVRAMRAYTSVLGDLGSNPLKFIDEAWALAHAGARKDGLRFNPQEHAIARLAMERWQEAGGEIVALCHAGLLGEI